MISPCSIAKGLTPNFLLQGSVSILHCRLKGQDLREAYHATLVYSLDAPEAAASIDLSLSKWVERIRLWET
jgi:hypothetical protein